MFISPAFAAETTGKAQPGETHAGTEAGHGGGGGVFPPFATETYPSQLLWLAISFGLFYLFINRVIMPRVGGILEDRRDRIAADLDQAAKLKDEADAAIAAYEQGLAEARQRAGKIANDAREAAKAEAEAERKSVEAGLDRKLADAEARIASIKAGAMQDVGTIAEDTASAIVDSLVGGGTGPDEVAAAVRAVRS